MTNSELECLDRDLAQGNISEDEYLERLRSEVGRLHQDMSEVDISNMFQMQLRLMAVEDAVTRDMQAEKFSLDVPSFSSEENSEPSEDADAKEAEVQESEARFQAEESSSNSIQQKSAVQTSSGNSNQSAASSISQEADSKKQMQDAADGQQKDSQNNQEQKQHNKDSSSKSSNRWWWTWQIVPDWKEWASFKEKEKEEIVPENHDKPVPVEADDIIDNASIESKYVIDLTKKEDGIYSI